MSEMEKSVRALDDSDLEAIEKARAANLIVLPPAMLEKDILVRDAVIAMCSVGREHGAVLIFAGGSSLSQAYNIVERMSEDIDFRIVLPSDAQSQNQKRNLLSAIKGDILKTMEEAGFPVDGELKARNGNAYIMGNFQYASAFQDVEALRPSIKVEVTAFEPVSHVEQRPLQTILERILNQQPISGISVPVVSIEDTLADKVVGYLRRTAAHRSGCGRGGYDDRLVRHMYDTHKAIEQYAGDGLMDRVAPLFLVTVERDRRAYGNQFPAFRDDPWGSLAEERNHLRDDDARKRYEVFCRSMIYGETPHFDEVSHSFLNFSGELLDYAQSLRARNVVDNRRAPNVYTKLTP